MDYILNGFVEAFRLIFSFDPEIIQIVLLSLYVSFSSTLYATLIGIPLGILLGINDFKGKQIVSRLLYTLCHFRRLSSVYSPLFSWPDPDHSGNCS